MWRPYLGSRFLWGQEMPPFDQVTKLGSKLSFPVWNPYFSIDVSLTVNVKRDYSALQNFWFRSESYRVCIVGMQPVLREALFLESIKTLTPSFFPPAFFTFPPPLPLLFHPPPPPPFSLLSPCRNVTLQSWNVVRWVKVTINFNFST